ncbi:MAG: EamA family transporter [Devosia nanyangense]|uniref:EamA family transporter n=1 Tax=Devosia nanyangense TaxID=1228055 RepID=A0A933L3Q0_9HYPH|nr:EamA family transporter [Devosia nanyangense]
MSLRDTLLVLAVVTVWGINFVAIRWGVDEVPPLLLTSLRYVVAVLPAIFFVRRPQVALALLVGYGFAVGVGQFGLLFAAIKFGMPAGLASLVIQLQAFFTIGLAVLFLGERPKGAQLAGALIAFAGIAVIAAERLGGAALWPFLMTIGAAGCWGVANLLTKKAGKIDMLGFVVWSSLVPPIPLFVLSLLFEGPGAVPLALSQITLWGIGSLLFIGWVSTVFGYGAWSVLLGRYPASTVAPFTLLVPIAGIGSAALLLGERISGLELIGSALVFTGLLLNVFGPRLVGQRQPA